MSKITVIRSVKTVAEKGYPVVELAYKTDDGKTKGMKIFGFGEQKANAQVAGDAQQGDVLEAEFEQNAKGYWQFRSLKATGEKATTAGTGVSGSTPTEGRSSGSTYAAGQSKGNWETSEERAARQVMIVRQSSLSTAASLRPKGSAAEVISLAKEFEAFVMGKEAPKQQVKQTGEVE